MTPYEGDGAAVTALEARGLRRAFGRVAVVRDLDLTLVPGEALAVAGPNGAGKTTLLRLLAGLLRPTAGEITILGRPLHGSPHARRAIGFLSHHSLLYDDLTLAENLAFTARLYGLTDPAGAARAALESAGLTARAGDSPARLSRGLLQRAALARALIHRPQVLLLDEPFTALDEPSAAGLRDTLRSVLASGGAMVVVTHHLAEVWELATRVAVMVGGRWACDEPVEGAVAAFSARYQAMAGA
ncbi:MAG: heme ABC exporter ATP-binding protein CcmA [Gemmatimonadales bacterium]